MAKLKRLSTTAITSDLFNGTRSYGAALWAIEICNNIIDRANAGDIVLHFEDLVRPEFELRWDGGEFSGLFLKDGEGAWTWIVGDMRDHGTPVVDEYNTIIAHLPGKIHCTKRDIREYFKLWRVAKITNVSKVTDLTK